MKNYKTFSLLLVLQFLVYVDRGVVSGCSRTLSQFIIKVTNTTTPSFYLGVVQSSFIAGLCITCLALATATKYKSLTFLINLGVIIWMISGLISGTSAYTGSYGFAFLLIGRILSGVGEASLITLVPPFILQNSDGKAIGFWMGAFSSMVPLGTAAGFVYGAFFAEMLKWNFAFYIETCLTLPLLIIIIMYPMLLESEKIEEDQCFENEPKNSTGVNNQSEIPKIVFSQNQENSLTQLRSLTEVSSNDLNNKESHFRVAKEAFWSWFCQFCSDIFIVLKSVEFLALSVTTASYSAVITVFLIFGPAYLHELGFVQNELDSSILMGSATLVSGVFGSLLGGAISAVTTGEASKLNQNNIIVNKREKIFEDEKPNDEEPTFIENEEAKNSSDFCVTQQKRNSHGELTAESKNICSKPHSLIETYSALQEDRQMEKLMLHLIPITVMSTILFCVLAFSKNIYMFSIMLISGLFSIFAAQSSITIGVMLSVSKQYQNLAIALSIMLMHLMGDVPAPIIVGLLRDTLAPNCSISEELTQKCIKERFKLRLSILFTSLWLIWMIIGIVVAYVVSFRKRTTRNNNANNTLPVVLY